MRTGTGSGRTGVIEQPDMEYVDLDAPGDEGFVVLAPVFFGVDHAEVGPEVCDSFDVGVLRAADMEEVRPLAEASTGDWGAVPSGECLGDRGNQTDDSYGGVSLGAGERWID
jgi:hypothetical protein